MKYLHYLLLASSLLLIVSCQDDDMMIDMEPEAPPTLCELGRYTTPEFMTIDVTTEQFGTGETVFGDQTLLMDIYQPSGDTATRRPAVILAFGGAFIAGDRSQLSATAEYFAQLGYVAVAIDYRILNTFGLPNGDLILDTAVKAMHDVKAAVRYLRHDALGDNRLGIDPDQIIVGGLSAGAVASLQAAFFDEDDLVSSDDQIRQAISNNGGIEGTSNDLPVSSEVLGVLNYSGGMYDVAWIDEGEPWVISTHGVDDVVVPYLTGAVNVGLPIDFILSGSGDMHPRLREMGITESLYPVQGGGHVDIYEDAMFADDRVAFAIVQTAFVRDRVCQ